MGCSVGGRGRPVLDVIQGAVSWFVKTYPCHREWSQDLPGILWIRLSESHGVVGGRIRTLVTAGIVSPTEEKRLAGYCRRALINWARNIHRDRRVSESFDERLHSSSIAWGARTRPDPIRDTELREATAILQEAARRLVPSRADRLGAWFESGGDLSVADTIGLSRTTLQRDRRMLRGVLVSAGWEAPRGLIRRKGSRRRRRG